MSSSYQKLTNQKLLLPRFDKNVKNFPSQTNGGKLNESSTQPFIAIGTKTVPYKQLRIALNSLLGYPQNSRKFPGNLPVSLMRADIEKLFHGSTTYAALEKTDGVRYLLFFILFKSQPVAVIMDRGLNLYFLLDVVGYEHLFLGTILDVEYVAPSSAETKEHVFWVFDILAFCGELLIGKSSSHYINRIHTARFTVDYLIRKIPHLNRITFKVKEPYPMYKFQHFVECELPKRKSQAPLDGCIFVPLENAYTSGQDFETFKWKNGNDHTGDFKARYLHSTPTTTTTATANNNNIVFSSEKIPVELWVDNLPKQELEFYAQSYVDVNKLSQYGCSNILDLDQKIVECRLIDSVWHIEKIRTDKQTPNHLVTIQKTEQNMIENITLSELYCKCQKCTTISIKKTTSESKSLS